MPLHRNESAGQKTMTFAGKGVFVKENYHLSRERVSALTVLSSKNKKPKMELLFKGAGTRLMKTLNLPNNMSLQFAMKGSYREENVLSFIKDLPNLRFESQLKATILMLDNYSVHLSKSVRTLLIHKGYIPVYIGGGITGDIQVNDTHFHHPLKAAYREKEQQLMLEKLGVSPHQTDRR